MAVTRVNASPITGSGTSSAAVTITIPAGTGIQAGDLIVASCVSQGTHVVNGMTVTDSVNGTSYTSLGESEESGNSSYWQDTKWFVTPADIPDGQTFTFTPFAGTVALCGCAIDVFRGCAGTIDKALVGTTGSTTASVTLAGPALGSAPTAGSLVLSLVAAGPGVTLTVAAPFTAGSVNTAARSCGVGYVLSADGASTYAVNWTQSASNSWSAQVVSFAASTPAVPVQPATPGKTWRRRFKHPQALSYPPAQPAAAPPAYVPQSVRVRLPANAARALRRQPGPVPAQEGPEALQPARRPAGIMAFRRSRPIQAVFPQPVAPPAYAPQAVRARARFYQLFRGRQPQPVPPQVAPAAPAFVPQPSRKRSLLLFAARSRRAAPAPGQDMPLPGRRRIAAPFSIRRRLQPPARAQDSPVAGRRQPPRLPGRRAGRIWQAVPPQFPLRIPDFRSPARLKPPLSRRGKAAQPVPAQAAVAAPANIPQALRSRAKFYRLSRGRQAQRVPPQITVTPPAYVPQGSRMRSRLVLFLRRVKSFLPPQKIAQVDVTIEPGALKNCGTDAGNVAIGKQAGILAADGKAAGATALRGRVLVGVTSRDGKEAASVKDDGKAAGNLALTLGTGPMTSSRGR